jgi:hypothetical protein
LSTIYNQWLNFKHFLPESLKIFLNRTLRLPVRFVSAPLRIVPDFVIAGAQKSGTTSLYNFFLQHPEVHGALGQETHYFDRHYHKSTYWYRAHFPVQNRNGKQNPAGESCPDYMIHPEAPERIRSLLPECRLIFLLRNPVSRAYSHYRHSKRKNYEPLSFREALNAEEIRLRKARKRAERNGEYPPDFYNFSYKYRGYYAKHLKNFLSVFPREQILVVRSENLFRQPKRTFERICGHLDVKNSTGVDFRPFNRGDTDQPDPSQRRRLQEHFRDKNEELYELLDWSDGW